MLSAPAFTPSTAGEGDAGTEAVVATDRFVVYLKLGNGWTELLSAPDVQLVEDYEFYSVVDGTNDTADWLDTNDYLWWYLPLNLSHGNYNWDPFRSPSGIPSNLTSPNTTYRLVQFTAPIKPGWLDEVTSRGTLIGLSSNQTVLANLTDTAVTSLKTTGLIRYVQPYDAALRLIGEIPAPPGNETTDYLLALDALVNKTTLTARINAIPGVDEFCNAALTGGGPLTLYYVNATPEGILDAAHVEGVIAIQNVTEASVDGRTEVGLVQANESAPAGEDPRPLHQRVLNGTNETIVVSEPLFAVNDTADWSPRHEQLYNHTDRYPGDITHSFPSACLGPPLRLGGSGTHGVKVAGLVAGNAPPFDAWVNDSETNLSDASAFRARLHFQHAAVNLSASGQENRTPLDVYDLLQDAVDHNANITTWSWKIGAPVAEPALDIYASQADEFLWAHPGLVMTKSAGNAAEAGLGPPAQAKNLITVGASGYTTYNSTTDTYSVNNEDMGYGFAQYFGWNYYSSHGTHSERLKPLLVAPGSRSILIGDDESGAGAEWNGTSFSTPLIAGEAARIRQYFRDGYYPSGSRDPAHATDPMAALVKAILMAGAHPIRSGFGEGPKCTNTLKADYPGECLEWRGDHPTTNRTHYPNDLQGWGRYVAEDALYFADEPDYGDSSSGLRRRMLVYDRQAFEVDDLSNPRPSDPFTFTVTDSGVPLTIHLAWTDCPAIPGTRESTCVRAGLEAENADGTWYFGNLMNTTATGDSTQSRNFSSRVSVMDVTDIDFEYTAGPYDLLNVEQGIRVATPDEGTWTVRVVPFQIPDTNARYALAITGAVSS